MLHSLETQLANVGLELQHAANAGRQIEPENMRYLARLMALLSARAMSEGVKGEAIDNLNFYSRTIEEFVDSAAVLSGGLDSVSDGGELLESIRNQSHF